VHIWIGAVRVCVAGIPFACDGLAVALAATPWSIEEANALDDGDSWWAAPGPRYIWSMVGRSAWPKGVFRKSVGRSSR
jgi:hypothetical protein